MSLALATISVISLLLTCHTSAQLLLRGEPVLLPWTAPVATRHLAACSSQSPPATCSPPPETCPPPGFDSVANFNLSQYVSAPWYVQAQVPNSYQQPNTLYCVRALYQLITPKKPQDGIIVNNYANIGQVNGPSMGTSGSGSSGGGNNTLLAFPDEKETGPTAASKLRVGPKALQSLPKAVWYDLYGPYWIVAVGPSTNTTLGYDWAIILGGSPKTKGGNGCRPGMPGVPSQVQYFGGLWLFSRTPVDPAATTVMRNRLQQLGLDSSELLPVQQKGCKYMGA